MSCVFPSLVFHPFLFDVVSALRNWHISRKLTGARALARVDLVSVSTRYLGDINGIKIVHVTAIRYLSPRPRSFVEGTSPPFALIVPRPPLIPPFIVRRNCVSPWNSWRAKKVSKPARCIRTRIVLLLFHQGISTNSTYYAALGELITRRIRYCEIKIQTAKCNFAFARFSVSSIFPDLSRLRRCFELSHHEISSTRSTYFIRSRFSLQIERNNWSLGIANWQIVATDHLIRPRKMSFAWSFIHSDATGYERYRI